MKKAAAIFCILFIALLADGSQIKENEIPAFPQDDAVMASAEESEAILRWADAVFCRNRAMTGEKTDSIFQGTEPPFSFRYDKNPIRDLLDTWKRSISANETSERKEFRIRWADPKTALHLTATVTVYKRYAAADWVLNFENRGTRDTPLIEEIQALDAGLVAGDARIPVTLFGIMGDTCNEKSFVPFQTRLDAGQRIRRSPTGGRPSNGTFPFFTLQIGDDSDNTIPPFRTTGVITAIGWTGQWQETLERAPDGTIRIKAGMERTCLRLRPGERIRSPRILLLGWRGDRLTAQNRFRRLMLYHYSPKQNGLPPRLPIALQCFDRYVLTRPEWATESGQIAAAESAHRIEFDTLWFDAAWFEGGFPDGVGNWYHKPKDFPKGLKPVADACHRLGMRFILWFEPERVAEGSGIAREHPGFVFNGGKGGLFKLNDPAARRWLTDLLARRIFEYGIDIYRNDFNMDPLDSWRRNDPPDRQGMTEIRYVEGLYRMLDDLRAKFPGLLIDNCASGGRRIDLEMCMRSVPLWRSDTGCTPGHLDWNQSQTWGLSQYLPFHCVCGWTPTPYEFRSSATAGAVAEWGYLDDNFPFELAKAAVAEARENRKYWYGDFYPLTPCTTAPDAWMAYQLHRPDLDAGLVLAFRHPESDFTGRTVRLKALNSDRRYSIELVDDARKRDKKVLTGRELMSDLDIRLPEKGSSLVIRYAAEKN